MMKCLNSGSKRLLLGVLLGALSAPLAHADEAASGRIRYSCESPDGRAILVENAVKGEPAYVYEVTGVASDGTPQWSSFRLKESSVSKSDPNDVEFRFSKARLLEICDADRHPVVGETASPNNAAWSMRIGAPAGLPRGLGAVALPGVVVEYGDSCYERIPHVIRVDVAGPRDSEISVYSPKGALESRSSLNCSVGYSADVAKRIAESARRAFAGGAVSLSASASPQVADAGTTLKATTLAARNGASASLERVTRAAR